MSEHWTGQIATHILNRHRLRGIQTHGEAGSVDIEVVEKEQARVKELLARFQPEDRWNVDESAFYVFIPPERGLARKQMRGKRVCRRCLRDDASCTPIPRKPSEDEPRASETNYY